VIQASATGLPTAKTSSITVTTATPQLAITTLPPPNGVNPGQGFSLVVTAEDAQGNRDPNYLGPITLSLLANPGNGYLGGTLTVNALNGVATFVDLTLNRLGSGYLIKATSPGLLAAISPAINVTAAAPQLVITTQPASVKTGEGFSLTVTAKDAQGNLDPNYSGPVTLSLATNPGNGMLSGTLTVGAVNGIATFAGLSLNKLGSGYVIKAKGSGLMAATSSAIAVTMFAPQVAITTQPPSDVKTGEGFSLTVTVEDANGNLDPNYSGPVTLSLATNPGNGMLSGTLTVGAVNGIATFTGLTLNKPGTGYLIQAKAWGLLPSTSSAIDVTAAGPRLAITTQPPSTIQVGSTFSLSVTAKDANGNIDPNYSGPITLSLGANPGNGALGGTLTVNAVHGVATFTNLILNKPGFGYLIKATASDLALTTSTSIDVTPVATHLAISVPSTIPMTMVSFAVTVTALDANGNVDTNYSGTITISLATNPGGATVGGVLTLQAVHGVASFQANLDRAASGYQFLATASWLPAATSSAMAVKPAATHLLAFATWDGKSQTTMAPFSLTVIALDGSGGIDRNYYGPVTLSLVTNPGDATLGGTLTLQAVKGMATFTGLTLNKAGTYSIQVATPNVPPVTVGITVKISATQLAITTQPPSSVKTGEGFSLTVTAKDAKGNLDPYYTGLITLRLAANPGNGMLGGTLSAWAVNGVATFTGLSLNRSGSGYLIWALATSLTAATSSAIAVTTATTQLAITTQPTSVNTASGFSLIVTAKDANGNVDPNYSGPITLSLAANPGNGMLSGTLTVGAIGGVATFTGLTLNKPGSGYLITASANGLTSATSSSIAAITAAPQLSITTQPPNGVNTGEGFSLVVTAKDANGDPDSSYTGPVTLSLAANPSNGVLSGTLTVNAVDGVATFTGLTLDAAGSGYLIDASASGLLSATSSLITVTPVGPQLSFTTQPASVKTGEGFSLTVSAKDANGDVDPNYSGPITLSLATNPGNGMLSGTLTVNAVNGVATFTGLWLNRSAPGYVIKASASGLSAGTSSSITVTRVATQLSITTQPPSGVNTGDGFLVVVKATDANGDVDPNFTGPITLSLASNPGNGMLGGTLTVNVIRGVATFAGLTLNKPGSGYLITASANGLTAATSSSIAVLTAAHQLSITTQPPSGVNTGEGFSLTVTAKDANGDPDTSYTGPVTLSLAANPGNGTLGGMLTVNAVNGVATFTGLTLDAAGSGYLISASASGLLTATSSLITVTPVGPQLFIAYQPASVKTGEGFSLTVLAKDANGNEGLSFSGLITLSLVTNPGNGMLSGPLTVYAVNGSANFFGLSLNKSAPGYLIMASGAGLTSATSSSITVTQVATQLSITTQPPSTVEVGGAFSLTVSAEDADGNLDPNYSGLITVGLAANPGNGMVSGTLSVQAVHGVAVFTDLILNKPGVGYVIKATATGLTLATSSSITATTA
ncbi:beta strand repeat-containing protein, partial [Singulisphaera rosea]